MSEAPGREPVPAPSPAAVRFSATRPHRHILTSVVALLFLSGALPLLLFGDRLTRFNRDRLEIQQKEHQLSVAEALAQEVGEFVRGKRASVDGFARGLEAALLVADPTQMRAAVEDRELLHRYLESEPDLLKIVFVTHSERRPGAGRLDFVSAERGDPTAIQPKAEELLVGGLLDQGFQGHPALAAPGGGAAVLVVVQPVRRQDRVEAVLAGIVSLRELQERLAALSQQIYALYVTDRTATRILAHARPGARPSEVLGSDLVAAFRESGGTRTMPFRRSGPGGGREMLGAFATVPETGWGVFVEVDSATAFYAVAKMRQTTIVWSIASVCLALVLGTFFAGRIVRPIRELKEGALRLARSDFSRPIELKSKNEIGLLAASFNHMAGEIQGQMVALEGAARENKALFLASIRMLAEAIDEKDPYTRGHSERVTRYAVAVARAHGLSDEDIERVEIGALLHDVGKIGIDDRILRKPSVLTDEEFEIMKQHPEKGAHIMGAVPQLRDIVPGMRFHHEKVDGTGYPLGLKGDEIPLAAQIISVADTFDAMTTDRPYQKGMDPDFVLGKLKGWVGSRFRGDVVEAFETAMKSGAIESRRPPRRERAEVTAPKLPL